MILMRPYKHITAYKHGEELYILPNESPLDMFA